MKRQSKKDSNWYQPVGTTDSENFFCLLLSELAARCPEGDPGYVKLFKHIKEVWLDLCTDGSEEDFVNEKKGGPIGNFIMYAQTSVPPTLSSSHLQGLGSSLPSRLLT